MLAFLAVWRCRFAAAFAAVAVGFAAAVAAAFAAPAEIAERRFWVRFVPSLDGLGAGALYLLGFLSLHRVALAQVGE